MAAHIVLVRYSEIHLKGLNRPFFERALIRSIEKALSFTNAEVVREQGRIYVQGFDDSLVDKVTEKVSRVFGVHSVSPAISTAKDWDEIRSAAEDTMKDILDGETGKGTTFKVFARRSDKQFPMRSEEICRELGHDLLVCFPDLSVDVHNPRIRIGVEIRGTNAYVYGKEFRGVGGMPLGSNGKAMLLLSGGIDSPVAGYMISKRGVRLAAVHFYSYPYTSERARDKVLELAAILSEYTEEIQVHLVPFTEIQMTIYDKCPSAQTTILMRRMMMRIAERIARANQCQALITGESIGQVASQTMESLAVTDSVVTSLPVFRPLIGFDKDDIIDIAKKIGTFETSILPYEDCCTVFVPQHPVTKPSLERIEESETLADFEPLLNSAIENTDTVVIGDQNSVPISQ